MQVYAVRQVATHLRELVESDLFLSDLWISGEVSNLRRYPSGHLYFSLKDAEAALGCVLFKSDNKGFEFEDGDAAVAHGRISFYEVRGDLQFIVDFVQPEGVGALQAEFERLKARLQEEGLFDEARKRALPRFPRRIGVATSPAGAVFHDICHVLERRCRWPRRSVGSTRPSTAPSCRPTRRRPPSGLGRSRWPPRSSQSGSSRRIPWRKRWGMAPASPGNPPPPATGTS